jgi:hypothetical protein
VAAPSLARYDGGVTSDVEVVERERSLFWAEEEEP